jgi:hypothetical protein
MKITVDSRYYGTSVIVEAENVKIEEDISESIYAKKEDGNPDFLKRLGRDITDEAMKQYVTLLDDIVYYRKADYDTSDLILRLFEKLPDDKCQEVLKTLMNDYLEE